MHWNNSFARQGRVNALVAPVCDPHSGQPESKQTAVRIMPWQPQWQGEMFSRHQLTLPGFVHWWRKAADTVFRYTLAGDREFASWLCQYCTAQGWQIQQAHWGQGLNILAWREGQLMLGFWSAATQPEIDTVTILAAFVRAPDNAEIRHALLSGKPAGIAPDEGAIVCSCFSVGETAIVRAITDGCHSVQTLGQQLRCGSNCGSCIPELRALLKQTVTLKE
jgi:assimilatory nitrate reductase catalytic subunit